MLEVRKHSEARKKEALKRREKEPTKKKKAIKKHSDGGVSLFK